MAAPRPHPSAALWITAVPGARVVRGDVPAPTTVCSDSRLVVPGALFIAVPGFSADGHDHIPAALARGATSLLVQEDRRTTWESLIAGRQVAVVTAPDTRRALPRAAAAFYQDPALKLGVVGVTGTDGKTTTVHLTAHVLEATGRPTGFLSSASFLTRPGDPRRNDSHMTTLEAPFIQEQLAAMVANGLRLAVIEASSHGLALHRVDACAFDVAVFTTLSRDHLDFHETMEAYRDAKGTLFRMLDESRPKAGIEKAAIVNADDGASQFFLNQTHARALTYGVRNAADARAEQIRSEGLESRFHLVTASGSVPVRCRLAGLYNIYNCLAASAVALSQGAASADIVYGLESFAGVPGHLETVDEGQPFRVVLDIASTEQALRRVLETLKPVTSGKLIVVFGCAGERDTARREGMGRVAGELADVIVLTNEDPRSEDPLAIIEEIAVALRAAGREEGLDYLKVPDRAEAIAVAFERAGPGDTVLLAGKGAEPSIVIGDREIPWDEATVARDVLRRLM